jgi:hypothetical protein
MLGSVSWHVSVLGLYSTIVEEPKAFGLVVIGVILRVVEAH